MADVGTIGQSRSRRASKLSQAVRVMIVDDSLTVRTALARTIEGAQDLHVVCKTSSAELALQELRKQPADVVLLDLEMPGMGGLDALPKILAISDEIQVLVVSSLTEAGTEHALAALAMGATDTMPKPHSGGFDSDYCDALLGKIRILCRGGDNRTHTDTARPTPILPKTSRKQPHVLAIGASTGGIHAVCQLLEELPRTMPLPILVTQHLPDTFMPVFARQLELAACRKAYVAEDGMVIRDGQIYVAPGSGHLNVVSGSAGLRCAITHQTTPSGCTPSVDPMFATAATATDGHVLGVVLSGMGKDGSQGATELVEQGGTIFAQDQESSAVWGMPRAVTERGLASAVLPPVKLAESIMVSIGAAAWK